MDIKKLIAVLLLPTACALFAETDDEAQPPEREMMPIMLSLVTPVQLPSRHYDVTGLRLSILYGECRNFAGLDIGIANRAVEDFYGLGIGGINIAKKQFYGGQFGLINWNNNRAREWDLRSMGVQMGFFNCANSFCGFQDGLLNVAPSNIVGMQSGFLNLANDVDGIQAGGWLILGMNVAGGSVRGCQIGLLNYAGRMECGLQIGVINIISRHGWLPVLPIVNGRF